MPDTIETQNGFATLKAGDEVGVSYYRSDWLIERVERVTTTQIVVGGKRFRVRDGRQCGDDARGRLRLATAEFRRELDEARAAEERDRRRYALAEIALWRSLSDAAVNEVWAVVERVKGERDAK